MISGTATDTRYSGPYFCQWLPLHNTVTPSPHVDIHHHLRAMLMDCKGLNAATDIRTTGDTLVMVNVSAH